MCDGCVMDVYHRRHLSNSQQSQSDQILQRLQKFPTASQAHWRKRRKLRKRRKVRHLGESGSLWPSMAMAMKAMVSLAAEANFGDSKHGKRPFDSPGTGILDGWAVLST